ncbi:MAG: hypothetical protein N2C14_26050 [Planctomycetales bacterium]
MQQNLPFGFRHATPKLQRRFAEQLVDSVWEVCRPQFVEHVLRFITAALTPAVFLDYETGLKTLIRQFARRLLERTVNALEPEESEQLPRELWFQSGGYVRRNKKTPNAHVATLFGTVRLRRRGYRSWESGEPSLFPLELLLGLTRGVSPGLADWLGRAMAQAGASQKRVLENLREECGVGMGVKRLREFTQQLSESFADLRQTHQVELLLDALETARRSKGNRKPVLAAGRDGVTLREYRHRCFEIATAATVSVYDRAGKRLATVYLAWPPELGQATMDRMLTDLLTEVLTRWQGPLPQLAYVADCGSNESGYYQQTLRRMIHPRTDKQLDWVRVADFYHVAERVWTMAGALFGPDTREGSSWARRMLKALKKPSGVSRVLHSAASHFHRRSLKNGQAKEYHKACRYIRRRTHFCRYADYASRHIPLGSGVTEAACKTIFTQRLKLSGMRWSHSGAKTILGLRVVLLSGTWETTFRGYLESIRPADLRPYVPPNEIPTNIAA